MGEWLALIRSASCHDLDSRRTPLRQEHHPVYGRGRCTAFHACRRVAAGLRRIRFHDLRHTCASLLISLGESPKYIQKQLRHGSIEMTFDRYGHLFPDTNKETSKRVDAALFGDRLSSSANGFQ